MPSSCAGGIDRTRTAIADVPGTPPAHLVVPLLGHKSTISPGSSTGSRPCISPSCASSPPAPRRAPSPCRCPADSSAIRSSPLRPIHMVTLATTTTSLSMSRCATDLGAWAVMCRPHDTPQEVRTYMSPRLILLIPAGLGNIACGHDMFPASLPSRRKGNDGSQCCSYPGCAEGLPSKSQPVLPRGRQLQDGC